LKKSLAEKIAAYDYRRLSEVLALPTLSEQEAGFFTALKGFSEAYLLNKFIGEKYSANSQRDIINYFHMACGDAKKESVYLLFLNAKSKIISAVKVCDGTLTHSLVYPREIILQAITKGALSIILVHNHPSGDPTPSEADKIMTKKLVFSMAPIDISFLDHVIIGEGSKGYFSFYEDGLIEQYKQSFKRISEESERGF
jgi:DNA repair protein RadC